MIKLQNKLRPTTFEQNLGFAIANSRIEGHHLSEETIELVKKVLKGETTADEAVQHVKSEFYRKSNLK